ncbi:MAG TPA: multicopper oxidase domain-containing protein, partial [Thermoanaerobaculia bacterium]
EACWPQWVRAFRSPDAVPAYPPIGDLNELMSGPTLRARVGDLIQLTFLNNVDPAVFGASSDGPTKIDAGDIGDCDSTSAPYPGNAKSSTGKPLGDTFPNCFHGSTTANLHFHGTHTNPNTTGDNVFLEILSSKRLIGGAPVMPGDVADDFKKFFGDCAMKLAPAAPVEWPRHWSDLPSTWTDYQKKLLMQFDSQPSTPAANKLWPKNAAQLAIGNWPQYYVGSYPYCFKLPDYDAVADAAPMAEMDHSAMAGAGAVERDGADASTMLSEALPTHPLRMGQAPGTHWYHAHKHGSTAINVSNGMSGAFIIEGKYDDEINEKYKAYGPNFTRKVPVMVINQFGVSPNLKSPGGADKGPDFSVNGRINPIVNMRPGEVQMWRIVNTSSRGGAYFNLPPQKFAESSAKAVFEWRRIAQDGVQFNDYNYQLASHQNSTFLLAAGNRADLLVKAPACPSPLKTCTAQILVNNIVDPSDLSGATPVSLLTVKVSGTPYTPAMPFMDHAPTFPPFLSDIADAEVTGWQTVNFATQAQVAPPTQPAMHTINGKKFDGEVGVSVLLNKVEQWKITNATAGNISHPFHIHINPFQVVEVFDPNEKLSDGTTSKYVTTGGGQGLKPGQCYLDPDGDPESWKPCNPAVVPSSKNEIWWDVFPIPSGVSAKKADGSAIIIPGYFKMRSRFVDYPGYYVIHCHILAHEDRGMMTVVEVTPLLPPFSHH